MADYTLDGRLEIKATESDGEWAHFEGVASTSDRDLHEDVIAEGAFGNPDPGSIAMLWSHDTTQPVGKWESLRQSGKRLVARGALLLSLPKAREVYAMLKNGVANGMSVGFRVSDPSDIVADGKGRRTIKRARLYEISLCAMPANQACRIVSVKSYGAHSDVAANVARVALKLERQSAVVRELVDHMAVKSAEVIAALSEAGRIEPHRAAAYLRALRDDMRAGR